MDEKLKEISETLKKIERKIEDKGLGYSLRNLIDFEKMQEESRKKREEERNEEILKIQRVQSESMKKQESFSRIVAFTGAILALIAIYNFIITNLSFEDHPTNLLIIKLVFLFLLFICIGPLAIIVINLWKREVFGK